MDWNKLKQALEEREMAPRYFDTAAQAAQAIAGELHGKKIAFGGSVTLRDMGLFDLLNGNNQVYWHWAEKSPDQRSIESQLDVYITSVNALAETGEIVNIDGTGNRVANSCYGPECVYFVLGANKVTPDFHSAVQRARQIAAPKNAARLNAKTPCAVDGKCHDCRSPGRICRVMNVLMDRPMSVKRCEVIVIGEELGY